MNVSAAPTAAPAAAPRPVNVVAHIDASEEVVEPFLAARLDDFEQARKDAPNLEITAAVTRSGVGPARKAIKGLAILGVQAALPVAGFLIGGPVGLGVGLVGAAGVYGLGFTRMGLGEVESAIYHNRVAPGENWKGQRIFEVQPDDKPGLVSPFTDGLSDTHAPSGYELGTYLAQNMDKNATNIVFLSGHGLGYRQVASMPTSRVHDALALSQRQSGVTPEVIVMESCLMGNLEALEHLQGQAHVAVVSEETLNVAALPLTRMLSSATQGGTPQEIGKRMVELAAQSGEVQTLAAVDLDQLPALNSALDATAERLLAEVRAGNKDEILAAAKEASRYPQGKMLFLERALLGFSDLGGFLDNLQQKNLDPTTRAAAQSARQALASTLVAEAHAGDYAGSSGMSFLRKDGALLGGSPDMDSYAGTPNLPDNWKRLIAEINS